MSKGTLRGPQGRKCFQKWLPWVPPGPPWGPARGIFEVFCRKRSKLKIELSPARELILGGFGAPWGGTLIFGGLQWALGRLPEAPGGECVFKMVPLSAPRAPPGAELVGF